MSTDELQFEKLLAFHCAPVLKKKKVANMFHIEKTAFHDFQNVIATYHQKLSNKGLSIRLLQTHQLRVTIYVYQQEILTLLLSRPSIQEFLEPYEYPSDNLDHMLLHLDQRLSTCIGYPHEIGLFLGYPLCDVIDFMGDKPCQLCGYWKVYHNVSHACLLFRCYDACVKQIADGLHRGNCIEQLIA